MLKIWLMKLILDLMDTIIIYCDISPGLSSQQIWNSDGTWTCTEWDFEKNIVTCTCVYILYAFSLIFLKKFDCDQSKSQSSQLNQLVCEWIIHISSRFNSHTKWTSAQWNKLNILLKFLSWFPFWLVMHIIVHCFGCIRNNEIFSFPLIKFQVQVP